MHRRSFLKNITVQAATVTALPAVLTSCGQGVVEEQQVAQAPDTPDEEYLIELFTRHLKLCKLKPGETLLFHHSPAYRGPQEYIRATLAAAETLGAHAFALEAMPGSTGSGLLEDAFKSADIVYGQIPLYSDAHNAALASGTRTLMCQVPVETLERFFPDEKVMKRGRAGAERLTQAKEIRVTDANGSDFTMSCEGREANMLVGISDEPGRWDQFPHGCVVCAPLENKSEGLYVVNPGDTISRFGRHVESPVRITLEKGRITNLEGGEEANFIRERIKKDEDFKDPKGRFADAWGLGHAGWGIDHRADWSLAPQGRDSQMLYGSVMVSIGSNFFDAPARYSGLGGENYTPVHIDICCRNKNVYLDGELVLDSDEQFQLPQLV